MPTTDSFDPTWAAAAAALVLVVLPPAWSITRHLVTLVHEAGHAAVAVLTGRRLNGIRLHTDTSGLTVSSGKPRGPGMIATAAAGYLAPAALGLVSVVLVENGRTAWSLYAGLATMAVMLAFIRNWFGLLVVVAVGAAVWLLIWRASPEAQDVAALTFAWFLLLAAPRATVDLWSHRRRARTRTTDADVLARITILPAPVWNVVFVVLTVGALAAAVRVVGLPTS
ncbi:M50 family metallopeptidase [Aeromicrobium endophyticum]|uniref:M50 family peptidase n=1 Tax=Aeromicrobium endophyticum TaxID=2292704 RepID=A0A371P1W1_9ACTN|nr:M50 family metallopeptidase [Aeromicrobium endophyticum]REK69939.1 M50 family peptidase [Aeromicrobium endophyticum]